jgi:pilus assembly protein CpaE
MDTARRVLLVDPNPASTAEVQAALDRLGIVRVGQTCSAYNAAPQRLEGSPVDLVVIVLDSDPEQAVAAIRNVKAGAPRVTVLAASRSRDGEMILRALRAGASEFLTLPLEPEEARIAIARLLPAEAPAADGKGKMITIIGSAGGVGCTTLAVNLSCAIAKAPDASVALVDLDLLLGGVDTLLDVMPELTIADLVTDIDRYDEALLKRAMTRHESGVYVLPAPSAMEDVSRVSPDGLRRLLNVLSQTFQHVIIDASKGYQETDFVALEVSDTVLLVTQLDVCGLRNGARLMQLFRQIDGLAERVRVVVNRVGSDITTIGLKKAEESLGAPIGWQIPNVSDVVAAARTKGVPLDTEAPKHRVTRAINEIARGFAPIAPEKGGMFMGKIAAMFT